jgi:tRNA 2-thiouridine synthesizing protein A
LTWAPIDEGCAAMTDADPQNHEAASTATLDTLGLKCPLPALRTRRALLGLNNGETLTVLADDPMAAIDIPHLVRELGEELLVAEEQDARLRFVIRRTRSAAG